jgi:hypothetical protein
VFIVRTWVISNGNYWGICTMHDLAPAKPGRIKALIEQEAES